jgi:hypothetical protein
MGRTLGDEKEDLLWGEYDQSILHMNQNNTKTLCLITLFITILHPLH